MLLKIQNVNKSYKSKNGATHRALANINLAFEDKGLVFILGKSGSGKSTLLNIIGGLDRLDSGDVFVSDLSFSKMTDVQFDSYRNTILGFIFQDFNLLENLTVRQNIALSLSLQNAKDKGEIKKALKVVDLLEKIDSKVTHLSGGQRQRVSIARALVKNPRILLADEPTGALDSNTAVEVLNKLKEIAKTKLVIVVSHDRQAASEYADRIIEIRDGHVVKDITRLLPGEKIGVSKEESSSVFTADSVIKLNKGEKLNEQDLEKVNEIIQKSGKKVYVNVETYNNKMKALFPALKEAIDEDDNKLKDKDSLINEEKFVPTRTKDTEVVKIDFKKGKFPTLVALKMGLRNLKLKKFSLFLTLLTATISLMAFSLLFAFGQVDINRSVSRTMIASDANHITLSSSRGHFAPIRKEVLNNFLSDSELENMLVSNRVSMTFRDFDGPRHWGDWRYFYQLYRPSTLNQITQIDNFDLFDERIILGRAPQNPYEILISDVVIDVLINQGYFRNADSQLIGSRAGAVGSSFVFIIENREVELTISGIFGAKYFPLKPNYWQWNPPLVRNSSVFYNDLMVYTTTDFLDFIENQLQGIERGVTFIQGDEPEMVSGTFISENHANIFSDLNITEPTPGDNFIIRVTSGEDDQTINAMSATVLSTNSFGEIDIVFNQGDIRLYSATVSHEQKNNFLRTINSSNLDNDILIVSEGIMEELFEVATPISRVVIPMGDHSQVLSILNRAPHYNLEVVSNIFDDYVLVMTFINILSSVIMWFGAILLGLSVVLLSTFVSNSIRLTKKQIGIFRALGSKKLDTFKIYVLEALIIGLISAIASLVLFAAIIPVIHTFMGNTFSSGATIHLIVPSIFNIVLVIVIAVIITIGSSAISLHKFNKISPVEAISGKEG